MIGTLSAEIKMSKNKIKKAPRFREPLDLRMETKTPYRYSPSVPLASVAALLRTDVREFFVFIMTSMVRY